MTDLIEQIGRKADLYVNRLTQRIVRLEVSEEVDKEIRRLLRWPAHHRVNTMKVGGHEFLYVINPKRIGHNAWQLVTELGFTSPEMAVRGALVNRSDSVTGRIWEG